MIIVKIYDNKWREKRRKVPPIFIKIPELILTRYKNAVLMKKYARNEVKERRYKIFITSIPIILHIMKFNIIIKRGK